jgi:hypothetical protein
MYSIVLVFSKNYSKPYRLSDEDAFMGFISYFLLFYLLIVFTKIIKNKLDK